MGLTVTRPGYDVKLPTYTNPNKEEAMGKNKCAPKPVTKQQLEDLYLIEVEKYGHKYDKEILRIVHDRLIAGYVKRGEIKIVK